MEYKIYDVIIVGAGTAGLSAAIYVLRAGRSVLVLEEGNYGGQIIVTPAIENYPGIAKISGYEFAQGLYEQAKELGMEYANRRVIQVSETVEGQGTAGEEQAEGEILRCSVEEQAENASADRQAGERLFRVTVEKGGGEDGRKTGYFARSVIFATGAKNRPLGIDRETDLIGKGISYCATCDGRFYQGRRVAVVGGGNTALEDALFLSEYCEKVYLIHRREQFRGEASRLETLRKKENVEIWCNCIVTAVASEEDDRMDGIHVWDRAEKKERFLPVAGLFIAIGQMPDNSAFADVAGLDEQGYIRAGEDCHTGTEGIFAAGDCRTKKVRQLTTAASDGAVAALMACEYLSGS